MRKFVCAFVCSLRCLELAVAATAAAMAAVVAVTFALEIHIQHLSMDDCLELAKVQMEKYKYRNGIKDRTALNGKW